MQLMTEIEKQDFPSQVSQIVMHRLQEILFFTSKRKVIRLLAETSMNRETGRGDERRNYERKAEKYTDDIQKCLRNE